MIVFLLFCSFIFSDSTLVNNNAKVINLRDSVLFMNNNDLKASDSTIQKNININNNFNNLSIYDTILNDLFYEQLIECKLIFADAITYDISLDTIETEIQFRSLFESLFDLSTLLDTNVMIQRRLVAGVNKLRIKYSIKHLIR